MHGPKPRSHAFKLNKKVRRLGLKIALSARAAEGKAILSLSLSVSVRALVCQGPSIPEPSKYLLSDASSFFVHIFIITPLMFSMQHVRELVGVFSSYYWVGVVVSGVCI